VDLLILLTKFFKVLIPDDLLDEMIELPVDVIEAFFTES